MRVAIGSDHAGFELKETLKASLIEEHREVLDVGTYSRDPVDYPDCAEAVGTALRDAGPSAASSSAAAAWARRWPPTGFPASAQACVTTPTRRTRVWNTTT